MSEALRSTHIDVELNVDTSPLERANQQIDRLVDHVGDAGGSFHRYVHGWLKFKGNSGILETSI